MQRPCEQKRRKIVESAARLFAQKAYHEVRLDEIAVAARVGKGTLYIYFHSKEDLFDHLLVAGFEEMAERVRGVAQDANVPAWDALTRAVGDLVDWAANSPHFYQLLRHSDEKPPTPRLRARRQEFGALLEQILRRGIDAGEFVDPHPELTAQFIPSCVRGALRFGPDQTDLNVLKEQILQVVGGGIRADAAIAFPRRASASAVLA